MENKTNPIFSINEKVNVDGKAGVVLSFMYNNITDNYTYLISFCGYGVMLMSFLESRIKKYYGK